MKLLHYRGGYSAAANCKDPVSEEYGRRSEDQQVSFNKISRILVGWSDE